MALLRRYLSLFQESNSASFVGSFDQMVVDVTGIGVDMSTPMR